MADEYEYTKTIGMTISRKKSTVAFHYRVNKKSLNRVKKYKYLGLIFN